MPDTTPITPTKSWQDIAADVAVANTTGAKAAASSAAQAAGAAAGTAILPGVGTVVGALTGGLLFDALGIKSSTQHLSWEEAETKATPYAADTARAIQTRLSSDQFTELALRFPNAYRDFVGNSTWWSNDTRQKYYGDYAKLIITQPTDYDRVRQTIWEVAHWILENVDRVNLQEAPGKFLFFYSQTLTPILLALGITDYAPIPETTQIGTTTRVQTTNKTGFQFSLAGFNLWEFLLIAGAALGIIWGLAHAKKGMR